VAPVRFAHPVGIMAFFLSYCNILLNPIVYIVRYEVVKVSLARCLPGRANRDATGWSITLQRQEATFPATSRTNQTNLSSGV